MTEYYFFFLLQGVVLILLLISHAFRSRVTMGPLFALAGFFVFLMWQIVQLGWWISHTELIIDAARLSIVPNLIAGALIVYVLDGLRAARAYWLTIMATGIIAIAFLL